VWVILFLAFVSRLKVRIVLSMKPAAILLPSGDDVTETQKTSDPNRGWLLFDLSIQPRTLPSASPTTNVSF